jgi:hypothetical protein
VTRGNTSYAKVLSDYTVRKEDENESMNRGFGNIRGDFKFGFKAARNDFSKREPDEETGRIKTASGGSDGRRDSMKDGR